MFGAQPVRIAEYSPEEKEKVPAISNNIIFNFIFKKLKKKSTNRTIIQAKEKMLLS